MINQSKKRKENILKSLLNKKKRKYNQIILQLKRKYKSQPEISNTSHITLAP